MERKRIIRILALVAAILLIPTLVTCGVLAYLYRGQIRQNRYMVGQTAYMEQKDALQNRLITQSRDSMGRLISTIRVIEIDRGAVRTLADVQGSFINRNLAALANDQKEMRRMIRTLKTATTIHVEAKGDFMAVMQDTVILTEGNRFAKDSTVLRYDSVKVFAKAFRYTEPSGWFDIRGIVSNDTVQITPVWRDRMDIATFRQPRQKKYWIDPPFLRKRQTVVRYKSQNPYSSLKDFQQVITENP